MRRIFKCHPHGVSFVESKCFTPVLFALILLSEVLCYVWFNGNMTQLENLVAEEIHIKEVLLEDRKKLKIEIATLKSPQRIEAIAKEKLRMVYPEGNSY